MGGAVVFRVFVLIFALLTGTTGCAPLIAGYDVESFKAATSLKAEVSTLIDNSSETYNSRRTQVEAITTKVDAAYEFAAGLPSNQLSASQWNILRDPRGALYGGFVRSWQLAGTTSTAYRTEKKKQITEAFDYIICLEANKKESKACTPPSGQ